MNFTQEQLLSDGEASTGTSPFQQFETPRGIPADLQQDWTEDNSVNPFDGSHKEWGVSPQLQNPPREEDEEVTAGKLAIPAEFTELQHDVRLDNFSLTGPEPSCLCLVVFWGFVTAGALAGVTVYAVHKLNKDNCAHGTGLPGDVTAPSDPNIGEMVSIAYGFFPYVLGLVCLVEVFRRQTVWPLQLVCMAVVIVLLNEAVVKRLVSQDRPSGSCLHSKGMPSSHAELSIGFWFLFHLEVGTKWHSGLTANYCSLVSSWKEGLQPWPAWRNVVVLLLVDILLLPVPFTRVVLHDHSWAQVGVGALLGCVVASCWYCLLNFWLYKHLESLSEFLQCNSCGLLWRFKNDYLPLACMERRADTIAYNQSTGISASYVM